MAEKSARLFRRHLMSCNEHMTTNDRNPCTFNFRHFPVLHFPALHFCPLYSSPALSTPGYFTVRHFPVLHFQRPPPLLLVSLSMADPGGGDRAAPSPTGAGNISDYMQHK